MIQKVVWVLLVALLLQGCAGFRYRKANEKGTISAYSEYLKKYPGVPPYSQDARDHLDYLLALDEKSVADMKASFATRHPVATGIIVNELQKRYQRNRE